MSDSKNNKNQWMTWSFDCGSNDSKIVTPAKRPRTQKPRSSSTDTVQISYLNKIVDKKKKTINSLPDLLKACEPRQGSELSISRQKQNEICDWLDYKTIKGKPCAMILSGPAGCGKTVGLRLLAEERNFECIEWITPADQGADENNRFTKQGDKFADFMIRSTRYNSLFENYSRRLLLVKDLPNVYLGDKDSFHALLEQYFNLGKESIVFICTNYGGIGVLQTLFPPKIREQFGIDHISINSVTQTATKNVLKRVATVFNTQASHMVNVSQSIIDETLSNSIGDIRSTIINLIFASLKVPNNETKCEGKARGESLDLLHAVGRVINPKRIIKGDSWKFLHDPDEIAYFFQSMPSTFVGFLHQNYLNTIGIIEEATMAADILSVSECLVNDWRDFNLGKLGLSFCIRGIMASNEHPVSNWNPVRKPPDDKKIIRDLASAETSFYASLINPELNSSTTKGLRN